MSELDVFLRDNHRQDESAAGQMHEKVKFANKMLGMGYDPEEIQKDTELSADQVELLRLLWICDWLDCVEMKVSELRKNHPDLM